MIWVEVKVRRGEFHDDKRELTAEQAYIGPHGALFIHLVDGGIVVYAAGHWLGYITKPLEGNEKNA